MSRTTAIGALLLGLSLVLLAPRAQAQDRVHLGGCQSSYITTFDFNAKKISELIGSTGYQAVMTLGTGVEESHTCQKLQLFEGAAFSYSYTDADGKRRLVSGRYRAVPTSFKTHGFLEMSGLPAGVLGATIFGIAHLFPLVSREDAHVYLSCSQLGFVHTENVYTFVPNTPAALRDTEDVRETLALMGVPYSKTLVRSNQTCDSSNDIAGSDTSTSDIATSNASSRNSSSTDTTLRRTFASDASSSGASASNASSSGVLASAASSSGASSSNASLSGVSASNASSSSASASNASSSGVSASATSSSGASSSNASLSGVSASNTSSSGASASDASSGPAASSDASSSDVLPSGASSNDALASVASSIDALASDALSLDASSNKVPVASSPAKDLPQRDVDSNAVEDGPKEASLEVVEEEPVTESSVDDRQAS